MPPPPWKLLLQAMVPSPHSMGKSSCKCALLSWRNAPKLSSSSPLHTSEEINLINALYPPLASIGQALKDQWLRSNLAKSNQRVRYDPKISLRKPTFLSCFMSINSPTLWINYHLSDIFHFWLKTPKSKWNWNHKVKYKGNILSSPFVFKDS